MRKHVNRGDKFYYPVNQEKYAGRGPCVVRSSWEEAFMRWADTSPVVVQWSSEEIFVKYQDPIEPIRNGKPKFKTYIPDFVVTMNSGETLLIEIKPYKETHAPKKSSAKSRKTVITEEKTWAMNQAKWRAAKNFCDKKGWTFKILTERELFGK